MFKRKGQQAAGKAGQLAVQQFRMAGRRTVQLRQYRLNAVEGVQQPEQRYIGHREVRHPLVAFTAHCHQALTPGRKAVQQITQFAEQ